MAAPRSHFWSGAVDEWSGAVSGGAARREAFSQPVLGLYTGRFYAQRMAAFADPARPPRWAYDSQTSREARRGLDMAPGWFYAAFRPADKTISLHAGDIHSHLACDRSTRNA